MNIKRYAIAAMMFSAAVFQSAAQPAAPADSLADRSGSAVTANAESASGLSSDAREVLYTQNLDDVLAAVEANNPELISIMSDVEAQSLQMKSENMLEDPSVEYSSFYKGGVSGQAGSELVVSQGFDFPTLYAAKHKRNELSRASLNSSLANERRRILLDAKSLCLDIIMYRQTGELLSMQSEIADELLLLYRQRLESGDASALEVNKIRMELMSVATDVAANSAALDAACRALQSMNGGQPIVFDADFYPLVEEVVDPDAAVEEYLSSDASIHAAESAAEAAQKEIAVNRQGWIPRFEVGYRRNTDIREAEHGFLVGGSIPLFSNHRKVATAKARSVAASSALNSVRLQSEAEVRSILTEIRQTESALSAYDEPLMRETLSLLQKAVESGEISLIDYFVETSSIYSSLTSCITLRNNYHKLMARLYKNRL